MKNNKIDYKTLTEDEKDDIIVSFMHQQELDYFCHSINKERYENLIEDDELPEGSFKENIRNQVKEIESRLIEVEKIIEYTTTQLPSKERIDKAIKRMKEKNSDLQKRK